MCVTKFHIDLRVKKEIISDCGNTNFVVAVTKKQWLAPICLLSVHLKKLAVASHSNGGIDSLLEQRRGETSVIARDPLISKDVGSRGDQTCSFAIDTQQLHSGFQQIHRLDYGCSY